MSGVLAHLLPVGLVDGIEGILDGNTLELKPGAYTNYTLIEYKHNLAFINKTPTFKLANDTSIPEHTINQEDTRIY